jgi:peptidase M28-like protein/PDZ domain-containing protein/PA domain-containing protein
MKLTQLIQYSVLASLLVSCASGPRLAGPPSTSSPDITDAEITYHIEYLASDELEGRGTGTLANDVAAEYIKREFERYGLKPAGDKWTYFQSFPVVTGVELGSDNLLTLTRDGAKSTWVAGKNYTPFTFSASGTASSEIVCVGYGITSRKLKHEDYKNIDVKGKIALAFAGHPDEDNPHSGYFSVSSIRSKALFAREAGASALLLVNAEKSGLYPLKFDNSSSNAGIVVVNITNQVADAMLAAVSKTTTTLLETLNEEGSAFKSFVLENSTCEVSSDVQMIRNSSMNVVGEIEGSDPSSKKRYIVFGGHYDHLGWGQDGSLYKGKEPMIHNGADDNASGTAGVLEIAQYFSVNKPKHSMLFMAYSGEEMGLLGSGYWVKNPTVPLENITAMINMDMIGRLNDSTRKLNAQGVGTSPLWESILEDLNKEHKFQLGKIADGAGASDQSSFYNKDIPVLFFYSGLHSDYHRPSDDFQKINVAGVKQILDFITDAAKRMDNEPDKIAFTKVKRDESQQVQRFNIYVGTIPDYGAEVEGFKLSGVSPGGPAEIAGIKGGDIMVKFGDTEVKSIYDYMNAMGRHKPGEEIPVVVDRNGELITVTVIPTKK